jgi:hypothetical protein
MTSGKMKKKKTIYKKAAKSFRASGSRNFMKIAQRQATQSC